MKLYMRIAPELYLKRLIVGGFEKIYELNRVFRNEGISIKHNPEFTLLELYQAFADYDTVMKLTEEVIAAVAQEVLGTTQITYQGQEIDLTPPWRRISMSDAVKQYSCVDFTCQFTPWKKPEKAADSNRGSTMKKAMEFGGILNAILKRKRKNIWCSQLSSCVIQPKFRPWPNGARMIRSLRIVLRALFSAEKLPMVFPN